MVELSGNGELRFASDFSKSYAGDAFNTAVAARNMGSEVGFLTGIAEDPFAYGLQQVFLTEGVDTRYVKRFPNSHTGLYFVSEGENGEREFTYYRKDSAATKINESHITEHMIRSTKMVYATGVTLALSSSMRSAVCKAFQMAREHGVTTAFDPNYRSNLWRKPMELLEALDELLPYVDVILPTIPDDTDPTIGLSRPDQVVDYFWFKGVPLVVCKMGEKGCYVAYRNNMEHIPAMKVERVVDTTGAGDTFNGAFLHGMVAGKSLLDCGRLGVTAAGLQIQKQGTLDAMPRRESVYSRAFSMV